MLVEKEVLVERVVEVEKEVEVERLVHVEKEVGVRNEEVEKLRRDLELQARAIRAQFAQSWRNSAQFSDAAHPSNCRRSATATSCWTSSCSSASRRWR